MLRRLIEDFREFPATMTFCSLWVVLFALMVLDQGAHGTPLTLHKLVLGIQGGHPFGEMTLRDLFQGEIWRPLTATFVHYGLLHLGMNLVMMYQLGGLIESWYGPWQFVAAYVAIGFGGNLLSGLVRHALGSDPRVASGGGSTVVLGLAALCAVVGWRSRTRIGDYLRSQMVWLLIATAVIGQLAPIIDNWGHAGGALIGAALGFAHRLLIRTAYTPWAKSAGVLGVLLLVASGAAQVRDDRIEALQRERVAREVNAAMKRAISAQQTTQTLLEIMTFYRLANARSRVDSWPLVPESFRRARPESQPAPVPAPTPATPGPVTPAVETLSLWDSSDEEFLAALKRELARLDAARDDLGTGPTTDDFRRVRTLLSRVLKRPESDRTVHEFQGRLNALIRRAQQDQNTTRTRFESLARQARVP